MTSSLGDFLQAARGRVRPAAVGLPDGARRRVRGLRREEVAALAGVSVDYYVRLEQGRETSPSSQVVLAVGRTLQLDEYGLEHLYRLAQLMPQRSHTAPGQVDEDLSSFLHDWTEHPALVLGTAFDVIETNALAEALFLGFPQTRNLLESTFLVDEIRALHVDWEVVARHVVAGFRLLCGTQKADPRTVEVRTRLWEQSPDFRRMWTENLATGHRLESKRFRHPVVGALELTIQTFEVRAHRGQELVMYRSGDRDALRRLQDLAGVL